MNELKYFLVVENGMQWSSAIIAGKENDKSVYSYDYLNEEYYDLDFKIDKTGKIFDNIYGRELHFGNKLFDRIGHCYGWTISKQEFETIRELVRLSPNVQRYHQLLNS